MSLLDIKIDDRIPQALTIVLSPEVLEMILDTIAAAARAEWVRLAQSELHSSREEYVRAIQEVEAEPRVRVIALTPGFADMVENGTPAFDLRETLLGPNSHLRRLAKHGGYYGHVPFRHGTPTSKGAAGTPMGAAYGPVRPGSHRAGGLLGQGAAAELGKRIYDVAKRLKPTTDTMGRSQRGGRLPVGIVAQVTGGAVDLLRGPNPQHPDPRMRRGHRTDIYAGMIKERHFYKRASQSQYMTFRTISTRVQHGWIHPGITPHEFAPRVQQFIARVAPATIRSVLDGALPPRGFGGKP